MTKLLRILLLASAAAVGASSAPSQTPAVQAVSAATLVPADFKVPTAIEGPGFRLVPLSPAIADIDLAAYMSSVEHLQQTFSRNTRWPHAGITHADAIKDMEGEQARFQSRKSFAFAVLTPDGKRERGCVYVSPSPVKPYDAVVRMWVTKAEYDAGFDAELYAWMTKWIAEDWPFGNPVYPGRSVEWTAWDKLVAASPKPAA